MADPGGRPAPIRGTWTTRRRRTIGRAGERYRRNLDQAAGRHAENLQDAKDEARRAIVAWLDGKDPMDLQAADLPTLAASLGGDEAAIMAAFEQKVGRVPPVTHSDTRPGSTGDQPTRSDSTPFEITQQNTNGPDRATIH